MQAETYSCFTMKQRWSCRLIKRVHLFLRLQWLKFQILQSTMSSSLMSFVSHSNPFHKYTKKTSNPTISLFVSSRRKWSRIIYCWLVWCERKILFQFIIHDRIQTGEQTVNMSLFSLVFSDALRSITPSRNPTKRYGLLPSYLLQETLMFCRATVWARLDSKNFGFWLL